jgi:PhnB protein
MSNNPKSSEASSTVSPVPAGYHTVTPFVIVKGAAQFIDFMKEAFGAVEMTRVTDESGAIGHAEVRIGDSVVMLFDSKQGWPDTPAFLRLYIEDVDATYESTLKAGGSSVTKPTNMPWGDRGCRVGDPFGNLWWIMSHIEDVSPEEEEKRWGQPQYIEAVKYVQSADFFPLKKRDDRPS